MTNNKITVKLVRLDRSKATYWSTEGTIEHRKLHYSSDETKEIFTPAVSVTVNRDVYDKADAPTLIKVDLNWFNSPDNSQD